MTTHKTLYLGKPLDELTDEELDDAILVCAELGMYRAEDELRELRMIRHAEITKAPPE